MLDQVTVSFLMAIIGGHLVLSLTCLFFSSSAYYTLKMFIKNFIFRFFVLLKVKTVLPKVHSVLIYLCSMLWQVLDSWSSGAGHHQVGP